MAKAGSEVGRWGGGGGRRQATGILLNNTSHTMPVNQPCHMPCHAEPSKKEKDQAGKHPNQTDQMALVHGRCRQVGRQAGR